MKASFLFHLFLFGLFLPSLVFSKAKEDTFSVKNLSKSRRIEMAKFGYKLGAGTYDFSIKLSQIPEGTKPEYKLFLGIYDQGSHFATLNNHDCQSKLKGATRKEEVILKNDGTSTQLSGQIIQTEPSDVWFFKLFDCDRELVSIPNKKGEVSYKLVLLNEDKTHFSSEDKGFRVSYFFVLIALSLFCWHKRQEIMSIFKKDNDNIPHLLTIISLVSFLVSIQLKLADLVVYSYYGRGIFLAEFISGSLSLFGEYLVMGTLILIGWGWTLTYTDTEYFDFFIPISILVAVFKLILFGLGKLLETEDTQFHEYDSITGFILIFIRLLVFGAFCLGVKFTFDELRSQKAEKKKLVFLQNIFVVGGIFFLAIPTLVLSALAFKPENRFVLVESGSLLSFLLAIGALQHLLNSKKGAYMLVSLTGFSLPS